MKNERLPMYTGHLQPAPAPQGSASVTRLRTALEQLRLHWVLFTVIALTVPALVGAVSLLVPKTYEAHTSVFVSVNAGSDVVSLSQGSEFSTQRLQSYIGLVTTDRVLSEVISELKLPMTNAQLAKQVHAEAQPETVLLNIYVRDGDAQRAARIADSVTDHFSAFAESLERPTKDGTPLVTLSVVQPAAAPTLPAAPDVWRNTAFALLAGIVLAASALYLRRALDNKVRDPQETAKLAGAPLLVRVPLERKQADRHAPPGLLAPGALTESIRLLRARLRFAEVSAPVRTLLITSVQPQEGKTLIATHLAAALAEGGARVLLIDADLRRPAAAGRLGLEPSVGMTTVLAHEASLDQVMQHHAPAGFDVLAGGVTPPNPSEVLGSDAMGGLLREIRREYDFTIIDTSPAGSTADAAILGTVCDAFLFVVRANGSTPVEGVLHTHAQLTATGARSLGMVANLCARDATTADEYYR